MVVSGVFGDFDVVNADDRDFTGYGGSDTSALRIRSPMAYPPRRRWRGRMHPRAGVPENPD